MSAVPAPDRLAALQRHVLIAVAAFVVDGARVGVDDGRVLRGVVVAAAGGGGGIVLLGHCWGCVGIIWKVA